MISDVAARYLCSSASLASFQRLFSKAGLTMTKKRMRLTGDSIARILSVVVPSSRRSSIRTMSTREWESNRLVAVLACSQCSHCSLKCCRSRRYTAAVKMSTLLTPSREDIGYVVVGEGEDVRACLAWLPVVYIEGTAPFGGLLTRGGAICFFNGWRICIIIFC